MNHSRQLVTRDLAEELPALRAALQEQRRFRLSQLAELEAGAVSGAADGARGDVAAAVKVAAEAALADIDAALRRLDDGSYGQCERCGAAIPLERLEILPMSALCMPCQHAKETGRPSALVTAGSRAPRASARRRAPHPARRRVTP